MRKRSLEAPSATVPASPALRSAPGCADPDPAPQSIPAPAPPARDPHSADAPPSPGTIEYREETFFLHSGGSTYVLGIAAQGLPVHLYWGAPLACGGMEDVFIPKGRAFSPNPIPGDADFSLDTAPCEYPVYGSSDFRSPAIEVFHPASGSRLLALRYAGHRIVAGKPALEGLPATETDSPDEARTLILTLRDHDARIAVELHYTAFTRHPVLTRSARILNEGDRPVALRRALSASVDFPARFRDFHFVHLHGAWARETEIATTPLRPGVQSIESRRGASSHAHNPFFALTELPAHEEYGTAYGWNLVYSGNFLASAECDPYGSVRAQIGINPFDFSWTLEPGHAFQAPEAVLAFSDHGLGGLSRAFHRFYRQHLIPRPWRRKERPVLLNNWEATYFDFDAERIEAIARRAAPLGIELLVLDDGWFGERDDDTRSLGDWRPHRRKLPGGLADLARRVIREGLAFGLWFEPEMVSPDSDLYRAHPDWCLHLPGHPRTRGRHQLILDLSRPEVCEAVYTMVAGVLRTVPVSYVKWDMNRNMTEIGSAGRPPERQQETAHRYLLGLYGLLERFRRDFPDLLMEGCSGGGGRFDPGMLRYMPQIWTSDNSDAIARLRIQYGASLAYPLSAISAHVSAVPNHQTGRITPFKTRGDVAFTGSFGYELDFSALPEAERAEARDQIARFKQRRGLLLGGDLYRLRSPFTGNEAAWIVVSEDRSEALATHVTLLATANPPLTRLRLAGLDPDRHYCVNEEAAPLRGDFLMQVGLPVPEATGDFASVQWFIREAPPKIKEKSQ